MSPAQRRPGARIAVILAALVLSACTSSPSESTSAASSTSTASSSSTTSSPSLENASSSPSGSPSVDPPHPVSLPALFATKFDGRGLRIAGTLARTGSYTRYAVRYKSGKLTISGIMNVPEGREPFPVLVLNHGYIEPAIYTTGRGMKREQDYLARRGFVVIHVDYRNHAQSSDDPNSDLKLRLGYTEDVINAVLAVKSSTLPYLDRERVGLVGRSMGGGVVYNALAVKPGLVDAAVVFAPVSADTVDNFNRWTRGSAARRQLALLAYRGEGHNFGPGWPVAMRRTVAFLRQHLRA